MLFKKYWKSILGTALWLWPIWDFIKWLLDWRGRIDALTASYHDIGGYYVMIAYLLNPPSWLYPPFMIGGLALIWWNFHRNRPNVHIHHATPTPTPTPKPNKIFVNVSPSYLVGFYNNNRTKVQSDEYVAAYIGKWMPVTGRVHDIKTTVTGTLYVQIIDNDGIFISATLNVESSETISHIARDATIRVRGEIYLVDKSGVVLRTCELDESPS